MTEPTIAQKSPYATDVSAGEEVYWCACGQSQNQPFCDGSHKGTGFKPVAYTPEKDGTVYFCGCKHTGSAPLCDGTHSKL